MGDKSAIEWTDATWNPVVGCTQISPGCDNCYALTLHNRRHTAWLDGWAEAPEQYHLPFERVQLLPERLGVPLRWRRPRRVFVNAHADLFHEAVPDAFIDRVFAVMALAPQHTFQILTKRPKRMREYMAGGLHRRLAVGEAMLDVVRLPGSARGLADVHGPNWPLPNVWLGTSIELDRYAWRAHYLRVTPAAVRFISAEPLLGPLDSLDLAGIDWLIVGGESSGPPERRLVRPCGNLDACGRHPAACAGCNGTGWDPSPAAATWVLKLQNTAMWRGTAFFFKQWGGPKPTSGGRLFLQRTWDEYPTVRELAVAR